MTNPTADNQCRPDPGRSHVSSRHAPRAVRYATRSAPAGIKGSNAMALRPDRRLIAYCSGREVGLFDARKKQVIAQQPVTESLLYPNLAFSPSGKQLACISQDKLVVWDVATGKLEKTIPAAGLPSLFEKIFGILQHADNLSLV